jgi:hypothetical protein
LCPRQTRNGYAQDNPSAQIDYHSFNGFQFSTDGVWAISSFDRSIHLKIHDLTLSGPLL